MDLSLILTIVNLAFLAIFIIILIVLVVSGIIGFSNGIFKSSYKLIFTACLLLIAALTLDPLVKLVETINIGKFLPWKTLEMYLNSNRDLVYKVPITNIYDTSASFLKGLYRLFNVSADSAAAHAFGLGLAETVIKLWVFALEVIFILTVGNGLISLLWAICFKKLIPEAIKEKGKISGALVNAFKCACLAVLFMSPLTVFTNMINQQYRRYKNTSGDRTVSQIGSFLDAYNSSLFAQLFFNWTVNDEGLTFDAAFFDTITTSKNENGEEMSIINEINNIIGVGAPLIDVVAFSASGPVLDWTKILTSGALLNTFDCLLDSNMIILLLPIAAEVASNLNGVEGLEILQQLELSDLDWSEELSLMRDFTEGLVDSGVVSEYLLKPDGGLPDFTNLDIKGLVKGMLDDTVDPESLNTKSPFENILESFESIASSKLFNRVMSTVISYAIESDSTGSLKKTIPLGKDDLFDISWGTECYILLDSLYEMKEVGQGLIDMVFTMTDKSSDEITSTSAIFDFVAETCSNQDYFNKFKKAFIGETEENKIDKNGRSIVFENKKKLEGRHFGLSDLSLFKRVVIPGMKNIFESDLIKNSLGESVEIDDFYYKEELKKLDQGNVLLNYKNQFSELLDAVQVLGEDKDLIKGFGNNFIDLIEDDNFLTIDSSHIEILTKLLRIVNDNEMLYSIVTPIIKEVICGGAFDETFSSIGIRTDLIGLGIDRDMKKSNHTLYNELADLFSCWDDVNNIASLVSVGEDQNALIEELANGRTISSIGKLLNKIVNLSFFNPAPMDGDTIVFERNENFFSILETLFSSTENLGITVTRDDLRSVEQNGHLWTNDYDGDTPIKNENGYYGEIYYILDIIQFIAERDYLNAFNEPDFSDPTFLRSLASNKDEDLNLPGLLAKFDNSYLLRDVVGDFLDTQLIQMEIFNVEGINLTFKNVESWAEESNKLANMLNSLANLVEKAGPDFINNFDLTKISDIPELNRMFHLLADLDVFREPVDGGSKEYTFGKFLYAKIQPLLSDFDLDGKKDLLKDPSIWNVANYGVRPTDEGISDTYFQEYYDSLNEEEKAASSSYYLVYRDFISIKESATESDTAGWSNKTKFHEKADSFSIDPEWLAGDKSLYESDEFITAYNPIFELDEIGRICKSLTYILRFTSIESLSIDSISSDLLKSTLESINESNCLRICVYNLYDVIKGLVNSNDGIKEIINLDNAYIDYMISGDTIYGSEVAKANRQEEFNKLISLLDTYKELSTNKTDGVGNTKPAVISDSGFNIENLDETGLNSIETLINDLKDSHVFHLHGSNSDNPKESTPFQQLLHNVFTNTPLKDVLYNTDSPKDIAYRATLYSDYLQVGSDDYAIAKIDYLLDKIFMSEDDYVGYSEEQIAANKNLQTKEVSNIMEIIARVYGLSYKGNHHEPLIKDNDFNSIDLKTIDSEAIEELLNIFDNSELLKDCLPNLLETIFDNVDFGEIKIFDNANYFYHYEIGNYEANYGEEEISHLTDLIRSYSSLMNNEKIDEAMHDGTIDINKLDKDMLSEVERIMMALKDSNLFHSYKYDVIGFKPTPFQELLHVVIKDSLKDYIYNENSPKDKNLTYVTLYKEHLEGIANGDAKIYYLLDSVFNPNDKTSERAAQEAEIKNFMEIISKAFGIEYGEGPKPDPLIEGNNFNDIDIEKINASGLGELLNKINNSRLLRDSIPNLLSDMLSKASFGGDVDLFKNASVYYHYGLGDFEANYDESEIDNLVSLISSYQSLMQGETEAEKVILNGTIKIENLDETSLGDIENMFKNLKNSKIFHSYGNPEATSYVATPFQELLHFVFVNTPLKDIIYSEESPKDIAYKLARYESYLPIGTSDYAIAKIDYLLDKIFMSDDDYLKYDYTNIQIANNQDLQDDQIETIIEVIARVYGIGKDEHDIQYPKLIDGNDFNAIDVKSVSPSAIRGILGCLNESELLRDCTPSVLSTVFDNTIFGGNVGINFKDASVYYHYDLYGSYEVGYDDDELDTIEDIIDVFQTFIDKAGETPDLTNLDIINVLIDDGILKDLLDSCHDSHMFHLSNDYLEEPNKLTVFEQIIYTFVDNSSLDSFAYDSIIDSSFATAGDKAKANIKQMSSLDINPTSVVIDSYHTKWNDEYDEIIDLIRYAVDKVSGSFDMTLIDVTKWGPDDFKVLLANINRVDILADAVPYKIKDLVSAVGFDTLTSLDGGNTSYLYFNHNQIAYGGVDGNAGVDTEINYLVEALKTFMYEEGGQTKYYDDVTNQIINNEAITNLDGLFDLISNSRIFNTNINTGVVGDRNEIDSSISVSARGVLVYNLFAQSGIDGYIPGINANEKAHFMSSVFEIESDLTHDGYNYQAESIGLLQALKLSTTINPSSLGSTNYNIIKEVKEPIIKLFSLSYDANGAEEGTPRSYFLSQIIGSVFDTSFASENVTIAGYGYTNQNPTFRFSPITYSSVDCTSYDNLNDTEKNGFDGVLSIIEELGNFTPISNIVNVDVNNIINSFAKMNGSEIARVYYLAEGHYSLGVTQTISGLTYGILSNWDDYDLGYNPWSSSFLFSDYGNSLASYVETLIGFYSH